MASLSEILHYKAVKEKFSLLHHSERASVISVYSKMSYDEAYKLNGEQQGKLLFQLLYTAKNTDEIRLKIEHYIKDRK